MAVFPAALLDEGDIGMAASPAIADLAPGATEDDLRAQLNALEGGDTFSIESAAVVAEEVQVAVAAQAQARRACWPPSSPSRPSWSSPRC